MKPTNAYRWDPKKYRILERPSRTYGSIYIVQKKGLLWWRSIQLSSSYDGYDMGGASYVHYIDAQDFLLDYIAGRAYRKAHRGIWGGRK